MTNEEIGGDFVGYKVKLWPYFPKRYNYEAFFWKYSALSELKPFLCCNEQ